MYQNIRHNGLLNYVISTDSCREREKEERERGEKRERGRE